MICLLLKTCYLPRWDRKWIQLYSCYFCISVTKNKTKCMRFYAVWYKSTSILTCDLTFDFCKFFFLLFSQLYTFRYLSYIYTQYIQYNTGLLVNRIPNTTFYGYKIACVMWNNVKSLARLCGWYFDSLFYFVWNQFWHLAYRKLLLISVCRWAGVQSSYIFVMEIVCLRPRLNIQPSLCKVNTDNTIVAMMPSTGSINSVLN